MPIVTAHETWFTEFRPPFEWDFATTPASIAVIVGAIGAAIAWRYAARRFSRPELPVLGVLGAAAPWIPRLLAVHAGVSLLAQAARGTYLAPSLELPDGSLGIALGVLEALVGIWFITGIRVKYAAYLLVLAGPLGMAGYGVVSILERMDLLGVAAFLVFVQPGEDEWGAARPDPRTLRLALFWLRLLVGGALVVLAFTEKLINPNLAAAFLDQFPAFNVLNALGIDVSNDTFIRIAGGFELLFGLLLIGGALPQLAVIAAGIPFNATLFFLGAEELIGHLPIYGAMLALLIYGSKPETAGDVSWLPGSRWPIITRRR